MRQSSNVEVSAACEKGEVSLSFSAADSPPRVHVKQKTKPASSGPKACCSSKHLPLQVLVALVPMPKWVTTAQDGNYN